MREVFRGFRLKVKSIEDKAEIEIGRIMDKPTLNQGNLQQLNQMIIKIAMEKSMDSLKEGVTFGKYIASKT